jgi:hypothetical protein
MNLSPFRRLDRIQGQQKIQQADLETARVSPAMRYLIGQMRQPDPQVSPNEKLARAAANLVLRTPENRAHVDRCVQRIQANQPMVEARIAAQAADQIKIRKGLIVRVKLLTVAMMGITIGLSVGLGVAAPYFMPLAITLGVMGTLLTIVVVSNILLYANSRRDKNWNDFNVKLAMQLEDGGES